MQTVAVKDIPVVIGGKSIAEFRVKPIKLAGFVKLATETNELGITDNKKWNVMNKRMRMKSQVECIADDGSVVKLGDMDIPQLPRVYASKIIDAMGEDQGEPGKVINDGDGATKPMIYKLGTPVRFKSGTEELSFDEIEFMAKTYGDVEEVMAETGNLQQVLVLLQTVGKPIGMGEQTTAAPSWVVDQISLADGFTIAEKVLPRFLE
jgi:hypothetical protein